MARVCSRAHGTAEGRQPRFRVSVNGQAPSPAWGWGPVPGRAGRAVAGGLCGPAPLMLAPLLPGLDMLPAGEVCSGGPGVMRAGLLRSSVQVTQIEVNQFQ